MERTPFPVELQYPYGIVSDAIEFISGAGDQPFILQLGFSEPHDPEQVPAPYWDMFPPDKGPDRCAGPEALKQLGERAQWLYGHQEEGFPTEKNWRRYKSNYLGMVRQIDDQLARLVHFLDEKRLTQNTIVIYMADHGDYLMDYGLGRKGVGLPECLTRIPMVWSGAGITPSRAGSSACVSNVDFFPTICEALGASIPHGVQGRSLWPILQGKDYPPDEFRSIYATVGLGGLHYEATDKVPFSLGEGQREALERAHPGTAGYDELNKVTAVRPSKDGAHGRLEADLRHDGLRTALPLAVGSLRVEKPVWSSERRQRAGRTDGRAVDVDHKSAGQYARGDAGSEVPNQVAGQTQLIRAVQTRYSPGSVHTLTLP